VPVKDSRGLVQGLVLSLQDVTQTVRDQLHIESQAEEVAMQKSELEHLMLDLQRERERLAVTLNSIGDGVIATDATGNVVLINRVAEALSGWSETEAIGKPLTDVFRTENERTGEPGPELVRSVLERGQVMGLASHTALLSRQGDSRPITDSAAPILDGAGSIVGVVLAFQDVSEQRKLEEETSRANKLEALGLLAGGIGHDFNNLLTAIMGNIVLARLEAEASSELAEVLGEAERAATRARGLTQQLLTFAKGGAPVRQAVPLAELLAESAKFALRGSRLRGEFDLPSDVWPVDVDEGQISQVIQNLAINADEASPDGGTLRLSLRNVVVAADEVPPLAPGRYVLLSVADHGTGIPPQYMDKVFDPYFTTKQKGSGLGLATTYAIVKRHDGHITVASQLGAGTTFNVYLPAAHGLLASSGEEVGAGGVAGGGRILLMDDEEVVRRVARKMLGHLGYQVDLAPDGSEAIAMYQQAKEEGRPYAAVVMDLTVPAGMGGREAVARLRLLDPEVRAIVSSGFSNDPVMAEFRDHGFSGVIGKPYRLEELSSALRRAIGGGSVQSRATSDT
jgi:PAS domain S-box-containing protein